MYWAIVIGVAEIGTGTASVVLGVDIPSVFVGISLVHLSKKLGKRKSRLCVPSLTMVFPASNPSLVGGATLALAPSPLA